MRKYIFIVIFILLIIVLGFFFFFYNRSNEDYGNDKKIEIVNESNEDLDKKINKYEEKSTSNEEIENMDIIKLKINDHTIDIKLEDNSSAKAFLEKLIESDIIINAHDYGNFEKVGNLGFELPTNDKNITTEPGDLILYQGNQITLYYDTNTWSFTKLGKVQNISQKELKEILGKGDITLVFSCF